MELELFVNISVAIDLSLHRNSRGHSVRFWAPVGFAC